MFKKHPWRAVELGHNDAFRAIDYKRTRRRHQGDFAHVQRLVLFHFLDRLGIAIKQNQANFCAQWTGES